MIIPGHLNFFSIDECGLYKQGDQVAKTLGPAETFDLIYEWVKGKPITDTLPWDPLTSRTGLAKCYCHDFYKCEDTGEYLFVLWKSESNSDGTIFGANANAQTGSSKVIEIKSDYKGKEKMIWGRPCYYWVIPKMNTVVSVKLDNSVCDSGLFMEWVSQSISNKVSHKNKIKSKTETGKVRFEFKDSSEISAQRYSYRFNVHLRSLNTGSAKLDELARKVTHIIRRDTIPLNVGIDDRPDWIKIFDKVPFLSAKPKAKTRQIEVRAEAKPTAAEIKDIIEKFAREERKRSEWNNIGFATEKSGDVWVDSYRLHETVNFSKESQSVFSAADIYDRLSKVKDRILAGVKMDIKAKAKVKKDIKGAAA
ncbi:hypothetical protein [Janthinobacterium sp. UMAB-56]|uniref:hypothetical protein n=1 Tax=Janthinobacterium sp. UMAB-56 TaxID=1365361 RepID=UPI001C568C00|nr:hypothetical protein [Janthinobacterium sp. UMAB-56]